MKTAQLVKVEQVKEIFSREIINQNVSLRLQENGLYQVVVEDLLGSSILPQRVYPLWEDNLPYHEAILLYETEIIFLENYDGGID